MFSMRHLFSGFSLCWLLWPYITVQLTPLTRTINAQISERGMIQSLAGRLFLLQGVAWVRSMYTIYIRTCKRLLNGLRCQQVRFCIYIYIYIYIIHVNAYIHPVSYVHKYACLHVCMYACMHACIYTYVYVCMHACMYTHAYVCMYKCMYVLVVNSWVIFRKNQTCSPACMQAYIHVCLDSRIHICTQGPTYTLWHLAGAAATCLRQAMAQESCVYGSWAGAWLRWCRKRPRIIWSMATLLRRCSARICNHALVCMYV